jgi:hypothetical protein
MYAGLLSSWATAGGTEERIAALAELIEEKKRIKSQLKDFDMQFFETHVSSHTHVAHCCSHAFLMAKSLIHLVIMCHACSVFAAAYLDYDSGFKCAVLQALALIITELYHQSPVTITRALTACSACPYCVQ